MSELRASESGLNRVTRTVLFVDRVNSTGVRVEVGEDEAELLQLRHDRLVHAAIERHLGTITKHTGDGLVAVFEAASDAVRAAIAAQRAIAARRDWRDGSMAIRIGLSVGDVVARDGDFFGMTLVEAQRLEASSAPSEIRCTATVLAVARLGTEYVTRAIPPVSVKGLPEPLDAAVIDWRASSVDTSARLALPGVLAVPTEFALVGRTEAMDALTAVTSRALETGDFGMAMLGGEPGIGKTRLAREVAAYAALHGAVVLAGHADEGHRSAYQPFADAVRWFNSSVAGRHGEPGAASPKGSVAERGDLVVETALVMQLAGVDTGGGVEPISVAGGSGIDRSRLFHAMATWLEHTAGTRGLYLVLDDLHWAADETLLLVAHLARRRPRRVMLVVTYRDTEVDEESALRRLLTDAQRLGATAIRLAALTADDLGLLTQGVQGVDGAEGADGAAVGIDAGELLHRTGGNPLFVGEYLRLAADGDALLSDEAPTSRQVPQTVADVIRRRVTRSAADAPALLAVAAVIGDSFELAMLATAAGSPMSGVAVALDGAARGRLLEEIGPGQYRFAHPMIRETLYEMTPATRRSLMHADVANALAARTSASTPTSTVLSQLAYHWSEAAPVCGFGPAVDASLNAGDAALANFAPLEAARLFDFAAAHHDDPSGRVAAQLAAGVARLRGGDPAHHDVLLRTAEAAAAVGDHAIRAHALVASGRWAYTAVGDTDPAKVAALRAALADVPESRIDLRASLSTALAVELVFDGHAEERAALCDLAAELALRCDAPDVLAEVSVRVNQVAPMRLGGADRRQMLTSLAEAGISAARATGDHELLVRTLNNGYFSLMQHGQPETALGSADELVALANTTHDPFARRHVDMFEPVVALLRGDLATSSSASRAAYERWTADNVPEAGGFRALGRFAIEREAGRLPLLAARMADAGMTARKSGIAEAVFVVASASLKSEAAAAMLAAVAEYDFTDVPDDALWLVTMMLWAEAAVAVDDRHASRALVEVLKPWSGCIGSTGSLFVGAVDRTLGLLSMTIGGDPGESAALLISALKLHRRTESPVWIARSLLDLANLATLLGDHATTTAHRSEARSVLHGHDLPALADRLGDG